MMSAFFRLIFLLGTLSMTAAWAEEGPWLSLFDGKSLTGWTAVDGKAPGAGWKVVEGTLHLEGKGGNILSTEEFSSFELEWDWKIHAKGNNGVKYWVTQVGGKEWLGIEYQMIDDGGHADGKPGSNHATASFYDIKAAAADKPLKPAGEWNQSRIIIKEGKIQHFLNGVVVVEADTASDEWKRLLSASKFRNKVGFAPGKGKIMLTDHADPVWYKNIRIRRL
ncbi:MAG: 3-keto-disaccharide hydrolase [Akkermansiaceae bacterium]